MSGQPVTVPIGSMDSVRVGNRSESVCVGIFDMGAMAGLDDIDGFLSLTYFRSAPVTVDYQAGFIIIEDGQSIAGRADRGQRVDVRVEQHGACSTDVFLALDLPDGRSIMVEVDTGSDSLILNEMHVGKAGFDLCAASTRKVSGFDETGHEFARYFATLTGDIRLTGAPAFCQAGPEVMFQKIIHDGLIGDPFSGTS
jgi:hypothetical protein